MKKTEQEEIEASIPSNAFMTVLQAHGNGESCQELTEGMQDCIDAVNLTGKPAVLTLKVKFTAAGRSGAIVVMADVVTKLPPGEKTTSIWFAGENNTLHREDPKQHQLPLRTIEQASQQIRQVS
jgi:hypothetical protein